MKRHFALLAFFLAIASLQAANQLPLTLDEAREQALKTHPRISAAELRALAAKQAVTEARAAYFPSIVANATAVGTTEDNTRVAAGSLSNPSIFDRNGEGVSVSQIITDFGRTANLSASAKFRAGAQEAAAEAAREQIVLLVDSAYFDALRAVSVLQVAQQTLATRQVLLSQVTALATNKLKSELDVNFAEVNLDDARLLALQASNDVSAAETRLSTLLGYSETRHFLLQEPRTPEVKPPNGSDLVAKALAGRPDLQQLRMERQAAEKYARAQRALNYPTVSAIGAAGVIPIHDEHFNDEYVVGGVNVSVPVFAGGLYTAKSREARLLAEAAAKQVQDRENEVIRDVRVAALSAETAYERIEVTERLLAHATQAYNLAEIKYRAGSSSIVELSQAQLNKTAAEIAHASARYNYRTQISILNFQSGAGLRTAH